MRRLGGLGLIAVGGLTVLVGLGLALVFGPDNRIATGPHELRSDGAAIVTAPQALAVAGPRVELTVASSERERDLFVGVGHHVDVRDFLADTPRTSVNSIDLPWEVSTSWVAGTGGPRSAPGDVDWWLAQGSGRDQVVVDWKLPDQAVDVLILDANGRGDLRADVTAAWVAPGVFIVGLALAVLGLGLGVFGWAVLSTRVASSGAHARRPAPAVERAQ